MISMIFSIAVWSAPFVVGGVVALGGLAYGGYRLYKHLRGK